MPFFSALAGGVNSVYPHIVPAIPSIPKASTSFRRLRLAVALVSGAAVGALSYGLLQIYAMAVQDGAPRFYELHAQHIAWATWVYCAIIGVSLFLFLVGAKHGPTLLVRTGVGALVFSISLAAAGPMFAFAPQHRPVHPGHMPAGDMGLFALATVAMAGAALVASMGLMATLAGLVWSWRTKTRVQLHPVN